MGKLTNVSARAEYLTIYFNNYPYKNGSGQYIHKETRSRICENIYPAGLQ